MNESHKRIIYVVAILVFLMAVAFFILKLSSSENYYEATDEQGIQLLKRFGLDMESAKKLLSPIKKNMKMFDPSKFRKKPVIFNKGKKNEYIIPPLNAFIVNNPLDVSKPMEVFKPLPMDKAISIIKSKEMKEGYFNIINVVNNFITRMQLAQDNSRLGPRLRNIDSTSTVLRDVLIDDLDWDWSDEIRGLTFVTKNKLVLCNELDALEFDLASPRNIRLNDLNQTPSRTSRPPSNCDYQRLQGTTFVLRPTENGSGFWRGYKKFYLSLSACSNGRRVVEFLNPQNVSIRFASFSLPLELTPLWIAHDPISDFILVPMSRDLSTVRFYDFSGSYETSVIRVVREIPLTMNNGQPCTIQGVVSGVFTESGLLHLVSTQLYGVYTFGLTNDNSSFELRHVFGSSSLDDSVFPDELVGIGSSFNDIFVLFKNNDTFDEDNLSIKRYSFSSLIPKNFSWNDPTDVNNYYNRSITLTPPGSQSFCGNCWSWACNGVMADRLAIIKNQTVATPLSVTFTTSCDPDVYPCDGSMVYDAYDVLVDKGTVTERCWDYNWMDTLSSGVVPAGSEFGIDISSTDFIPPCVSENTSRCITCDNSSGTRVCTEVLGVSPVKFFAQPNTLRHMRGIEDIKLEILSGGPVTASFLIFPDFINTARWSNTGDIYCHMDNIDLYSTLEPWDENVGGHAFQIVGWGEQTIPNFRGAFGSGSSVTIPYWVCKNSWSTYWGNNGYAKVAMSNDELGINTNVGFDRPVQMGWWIFSWQWGGIHTFDPKP